MSNYVEYDEYGLKKVKCMNCGTPVAERSYMEVPDRADPKKSVRVAIMQKLSNWRQTQKVSVVKNGVKSYIQPIVCAECENVDMDKDSTITKVLNAMKLEDIAANKTPRTINLKRDAEEAQIVEEPIKKEISK